MKEKKKTEEKNENEKYLLNVSTRLRRLHDDDDGFTLQNIVK